MSQTVKRAYTYRCYPTPEQAELLLRTFGCVRYVWHNALTSREGRLKLAKTREPLPVRTHRPLPEGAEPSSVTVSQDAAGRWFVSMKQEPHSREGMRPLPSGG